MIFKTEIVTPTYQTRELLPGKRSRFHCATYPFIEEKFYHNTLFVASRKQLVSSLSCVRLAATNVFAQVIVNAIFMKFL